MADRSRDEPSVLPGGRSAEALDSRVAAVLDVLGGASEHVVARRWAVDPAVLHRWVQAFVEAGAAGVTNRPVGDAARQRDRFLAAFAHETRTPLAMARGWVSMLGDESLSPEALTHTLGRVEAALDRLSERIIDVELLAACSLGLLKVRPQPVRFGALTTTLPGLTEVGGEGADIELEVDPAHFPRVLRDLWNAGSSPPAPRSLALEVVLVDPWLEIRVVRRADPIDTRVLQALFDPFDRNDDSTGVTIGLYLARALTVAHGGAIGVDQDEHGAALWVRVPHRRLDTPTA